MKNLLIGITLVSLLFSTQSINAQEDYETFALKRKVESYAKMKRTGGTLGITGGAATVLGIVMVSNVEWESQTDWQGNTNYTTDDPVGVVGLLGIMIGVPIGITGIVLNRVGARKLKYYQKKLNKLSLDYKQNSQFQGLVLTYTF